MLYFLAIFVGFTTILSMTQNSSLSTKIGLANTSVLNYVTGTTTAFIFFMIFGSLENISKLKEMHPFAFFGGLLGLTVVFLSSYVLRHISVIIGSMLIFTGQMVASFVIDYFRGISLSPLKIAGVVLIMAGIYVNNYIDYRNMQKESE